MKKENFTLNKKLKQYSALAGSMLAVTGIAHGQVVYTDITDVTLAGVIDTASVYGLDLNNDGTVDYLLGSVVKSSGKVVFAAMYPYTASGLNSVAGTVTPLPGNNFIGYPYALALDDNIDNNLSFFNRADINNNNNGIFLPAMFSSFSSSTFYGHWQGGVNNHYLGFKFTPDAGANFYFGWARCSVNAAGDTMVVKDYAYNSTPNAALFAGEGSPLQVSAVNQSNLFSVFGYEGVVNIFVNDGKLDGATVSVTNMLGETVIEQTLTDGSTRIDLNQFAKGIYLVTVQRGSEIFSKKISFR